LGESVSNTSIVVDAFPISRSPFFVRAGTGATFYQNDHPNGYGGNGWCWMAGAGYEIRARKNLGLAPMVVWSAGNLGDVHNITIVETGRRYSVIEFEAAIVWRFGKPRRRT
jgi:hypothetical protein